MPLGAPNVVGPISVLNTQVVVEGQIVGAKVEVFADGLVIAEGTAVWCRQEFPLKSGKTLTAGAAITARQSLSGETSPRTVPGVKVISAKSLPTPDFVGRLFECARIVGFENALAGSTVEVLSDVGGTVVTLGSAVTQSGFGEVLLSRQLFSIDNPRLRSRAGVMVSGEREGVMLGPASPTDKLPAPHVVEPVRTCEQVVLVDGCIEGASRFSGARQGRSLVSPRARERHSFSRRRCARRRSSSFASR